MKINSCWANSEENIYIYINKLSQNIRYANGITAFLRLTECRGSALQRAPGGLLSPRCTFPHPQGSSLSPPERFLGFVFTVWNHMSLRVCR